MCRLSDDEAEVCRATSSQTELATYSASCSNWRLSYPALSDDDGYDVIVDDSDDSADVFNDDTFGKREASQISNDASRVGQNHDFLKNKRKDRIFFSFKSIFSLVYDFLKCSTDFW